MTSINRDKINPIRYCIMDNEKGPIAYCYREDDAKTIINGLNIVNNIDPKKELDENGYCRFAYEDMRQYSANGELVSLITTQLGLGFLG